MPVLLSLETSTGICSAALHESGKLLASTQMEIPLSASSSLAVMINNLLGLCNVAPGQLEGICIAGGPGSYTGLRIGTATAKGMCYALSIPLFSVNTLELMAFQVAHSFFSVSSFSIASADKPVLLCPMLDARRMEVYCLLTDRDGTVQMPVEARVVDQESFAEQLKGHCILFFGNGADKCREIVKHPNAFFLSGIVPVASALGGLAFGKFLDGRKEDLSSYEPFYLKDFVAKKPKVQV